MVQPGHHPGSTVKQDSQPLPIKSEQDELVFSSKPFSEEGK